MAIRGNSRTLAADVYDQLRDRILSGRLRPGTRLRPSQLRTEFDVSVSVVREALTRLAEQQLVVSKLNLGFAVAPLSRKNLHDIVQCRTEIEGFAIRLSVTYGDLDWEAGVISAHHKLERTPLKGADGAINRDWNAAHSRFHAQLIAGCDNTQLLTICEGLFRSAELYRLWSDPALGNRDAAAEHKGLAQAALDRDPERAAELLRLHVEKTRDLALENILALHDGPAESEIVA